MNAYLLKNALQDSHVIALKLYPKALSPQTLQTKLDFLPASVRLASIPHKVTAVSQVQSFPEGAHETPRQLASNSPASPDHRSCRTPNWNPQAHFGARKQSLPQFAY